MMSLLVVLAIVVSIALGYRTKINTGFFAIAFAYLLGCFVLGLKAPDVIKMWPIQIFFVIFAVSVFYNFALVNGTLEKLAGHLMYACRGFPYLLPFAVFAAATIIAGLGAGFYTVLAFMAPITLLLCDKTGMSKMIGAMAVNYGALAGANFMTSQSGLIFRGLMQNAGVEPDVAFVNAIGIFAGTMIIPVAVLGVLVFSNGHRTAMSGAIGEAVRPEPFDPIQKKTLLLILTMMAIVLGAPLLHLAFPANATITFVNSKMNIGLVASVFSVVALLLRLGEEKKVVAMVPWSTLIMICGVGMLISVAIKAGTINLLASWVTTSLPTALVPLAMGVVAAIMSLFASTLGVVTPALFPTVPEIVSATGIDPLVLFVCIVVGAQSSAISPFSSGGSLMLGACATDEGRAKLFPQLLFRAVPIGGVAALAFIAVLSAVY
ncbi:Dicarboxylate carrier MatC domain-containing protein [uncultured Alphaproteobacteria bacterium]|uniref:Dicarboxylate carrier MatC domain-containing protein n=1 Tax=uncultured Alphaproteobacteria bacterium TaxID=91750 RepID=A0A212JJH8_9PROT|nr:Dicarboxylate carrier MatC domain-containing protein [uncultured Alphaproteobacteria bacterium]